MKPHVNVLVPELIYGQFFEAGRNLALAEENPDKESEIVAARQRVLEIARFMGQQTLKAYRSEETEVKIYVARETEESR
jgi:hypothetical protein